MPDFDTVLQDAVIDHLDAVAALVLASPDQRVELAHNSLSAVHTEDGVELTIKGGAQGDITIRFLDPHTSVAEHAVETFEGRV
jgi:hypothetical protein